MPSKNGFEPTNLRELMIWLRPKMEKIEEVRKLVIKNDEWNDKVIRIISEIQSQQKSTQNELTEHKNNHWRMITLIISISAFSFGIIGAILGFIIKTTYK